VKKRHLRLNGKGHSQPHIYNKDNRPDGEKIAMCNNNENNCNSCLSYLLVKKNSECALLK
jgi:hypothetical protein